MDDYARLDVALDDTPYLSSVKVDGRLLPTLSVQIESVVGANGTSVTVRVPLAFVRIKPTESRDYGDPAAIRRARGDR